MFSFIPSLSRVRCRDLQLSRRLLSLRARWAARPEALVHSEQQSHQRTSEAKLVFIQSDWNRGSIVDSVCIDAFNLCLHLQPYFCWEKLKSKLETRTPIVNPAGLTSGVPEYPSAIVSLATALNVFCCPPLTCGEHPDETRPYRKNCASLRST